MASLLAEAPEAAINVDDHAVSTPIVDCDSHPLLTSAERDVGPRRASDGELGDRDARSEAKLRWPVRQYSASSDPVTRDRRVKRLEAFIDRAKQRRTAYREPLRSPSTASSIRRVRTAPTSVRSRSSVAVSNLLWHTRHRLRDSSSTKEVSAESLLRRVGHHIKARAQHQDSTFVTTPSEERPSLRSSAPETLVPGSPLGSSAMSETSGVMSYPNHSPAPSFHLCAYRTTSSIASPSDNGSPSSSSGASRKSAYADTATTLTDVHIVRLPGDIISPPGRANSSPNIHIVESSHGAYHFVWDDPSVHDLSTSSDDNDTMAVRLCDTDSQAPSPTGLDRVNTKLEEWSFAARECTMLDKSRSHPHFRSYVDVYQDSADPPFDMDDDSDAIFIAPPNSKHHTPGPSDRPSRHSSKSESQSASSSQSSTRLNPSDEAGRQLLPDTEIHDQEQPIVHHAIQYTMDAHHGHKPTEAFAAVRHRAPGSRSLSDLSNTPDVSDNAASLLASKHDSVPLLSKQVSTESNRRIGSPRAQRDSVAIARERIGKKHANEMGEALIAGVGILNGVGSSGFERALPLDIPRVQQVTLMGVLSPIADQSPPTANGRDEVWKSRIDAMASGS